MLTVQKPISKDELPPEYTLLDIVLSVDLLKGDMKACR